MGAEEMSKKKKNNQNRNKLEKSRRAAAGKGNFIPLFCKIIDGWVAGNGKPVTISKVIEKSFFSQELVIRYRIVEEGILMYPFPSPLNCKSDIL